MYNILDERWTLEKRFPLDETARLCNFESIAKYSFLVQKSINPLDLSLREFSSLSEKNPNFIACFFFPNDLSFPRKFVSTEESCRKSLMEERRILYTLHLDLASGREDRLELSKYCTYGYEPHDICLNKLEVRDAIYKTSLVNFMAETHKQKSITMDLVRKQLIVIKKLLGIGYFNAGALEDKILHFLYSKCTDSSIVKDFLNLLNFDTLLVSIDSDRLEYILFHAYRSKYNLRLNDREGAGWNFCFYKALFEHTEILLKYQNAPFYNTYDSSIFSRTCLNNFQESLYVLDLEIPLRRGSFNQRRRMLWLQVIFAFSVLRLPASFGDVAKTLLLLWRSLPDAFFTLDEVLRAYQDEPSTINHNREFHTFYEKTIGGDLETLKPRSLKHYCRSTIRKSLCYNLQLRYGIDQLPLPPKLKSFLKLERD